MILVSRSCAAIAAVVVVVGGVPGDCSATLCVQRGHLVAVAKPLFVGHSCYPRSWLELERHHQRSSSAIDSNENLE